VARLIPVRSDCLSRRLIFRVQTPLGYAAALSRDRWREIVRFKHPALSGHETDVRRCLSQPDVVRQSAKDPEVHLYYYAAKRGYLCVVVAPDENDDRFVVTAYFTRALKAGIDLWTK
jgi:hypothetical protein